MMITSKNIYPILDLLISVKMSHVIKVLYLLSFLNKSISVLFLTFPMILLQHIGICSMHI